MKLYFVILVIVIIMNVGFVWAKQGELKDDYSLRYNVFIALFEMLINAPIYYMAYKYLWE